MASRFVRAAPALALAVSLAASAPVVRASVGGPQRVDPSRIGEAPRPAGDPYQAAQDGINWLMGSLCSWMSSTGVATDCTDGQAKTCMGCHVQAETVLGLARSSTRCYTLPATPCASPGDESPLQFAARFIADAQRKACILGTPLARCTVSPVDNTTLDGQPPNLGSIGHYGPCGSLGGPASIHPIMQSAHGGLNLAGYTTYVSATYAPNLTALADWLVTKQQSDGHWISDRFEAPVDQGDAFVTGAAVQIMEAAKPYGDATQVGNWTAAVANAVGWLATTATLVTNQDKSMALLALMAAGLPPDSAKVDAIRQSLLADQQADGGWRERPPDPAAGLGDLASNSYATGQALYALIESGMGIEKSAICSGIQWLVSSQQPDGSWLIGTTGVSTDSSRNSDFTATIWPVLALGSLRPFGASVLPPEGAIESCPPDLDVPVTIQHAADTACGLFARSDVYDLTVQNLQGDTVSIAPAQVALDTGGSTVVTVHWHRNSSVQLDPFSVTVVQASSEGSIAAGCPVVAQSTISITGPTSEPPPPAFDDSLRVTRTGTNVVLHWTAMPDGTSAGYEAVELACPTSTTCPAHPRPSVLDASAAASEVDHPGTSLTRTAVAGPGTPALIFYKMRAESPCLRVVGPTCGRVCSDDRCDENCP